MATYYVIVTGGVQVDKGNHHVSNISFNSKRFGSEVEIHVAPTLQDARLELEMLGQKGGGARFPRSYYPHDAVIAEVQIDKPLDEVEKDFANPPKGGYPNTTFCYVASNEKFNVVAVHSAKPKVEQKIEQNTEPVNKNKSLSERIKEMKQNVQSSLGIKEQK